MPIRPSLPPPAQLGEPMQAAIESEDTLRLLALRRSTPLAMLGEPGPSPEDVDTILRLAMRVPDHRKLEPWRILVVAGEARMKLGGLFADALKASTPGAGDKALDDARRLPLRAPVILCVISAPVNDVKGTPVWEQQLSAGALCQNIMIAACASGWAASWISEWPAFDTHVHAALGMKPGDQTAGFIYLGTAREQPVERQRPDATAKVEWWQG